MSARIGVDLGGTKVAGVLLEDAGEVKKWVRKPTPKGDYAGTLATISDVVAELTNDADLPLGIGTPGAIRPGDGHMKNCNSTWLNGQPLQNDLEAALGRPVRMANDANCFALAEARQGAGAAAATVFGVILGTGVGGGLVINGKPVLGANGLAGEWGHTPLPDFRSDPLQPSDVSGIESRLADRPCYCGRINCIETFLNGGGLRRLHKEIHGKSAQPEEIAEAGDHRKETTWHLYCTLVARSLAQIVNIMDPEIIVIGGGVSNAVRLYGPVNDMLSRYVFGGECITRVVPAVGGDAVGAVGAAWLWPA